MRGLIIAIILLAVASGPLHAAPVVELSQDQLRTAVSSKSVINPRRVYAAVESQMKSEPVDIRVFKSKRVYYRVLVKNSNGKITSIIVDAVSGTLISRNSSIARKINAAASDATVTAQVSSAGSESSNGSSSGSSGGSSSGGSSSSGGGSSGGGGGGSGDDDDQGGNDDEGGNGGGSPSGPGSPSGLGGGGYGGESSSSSGDGFGGGKGGKGN